MSDKINYINNLQRDISKSFVKHNYQIKKLKKDLDNNATKYSKRLNLIEKIKFEDVDNINELNKYLDENSINIRPDSYSKEDNIYYSYQNTHSVIEEALIKKHMMNKNKESE